MNYLFIRVVFLLCLIPEPAAFAASPGKKLAPGVYEIGEMPKKHLKEASGVIRSRNHDNVFWTHNDGSVHELIAIDRTGKVLSKHRVSGIFMWDWEDIADDDQGRLYLADTGNNLKARRIVNIHRVREPEPHSKDSIVEVDTSWQLRFPDKSFDAEGLVIWNGYGFIVSKTEDDQPAGLYRWPLTASKSPVVLESLGNLNVTSGVCGADLSRDGSLLGLVMKDGAGVFRLTDAGPASAIGQSPYQVDFKPGQIEGCTFLENGLLAVAESQEIFLFNDPPFIP